MPTPLRLRSLARLSAAMLVLAATAVAQAGGADLAARLDRLESADPGVREAALAELAESGPEGALAALRGAGDAGLAARRARAHLVSRTGEEECIEGAIAWLDEDEPDAATRRSLIDFLARPDLGDARGEERAAALARVAERDAEPDLVEHAVQALASLRHPAAGRALDGLVDGLAGPVRMEAARALANTAEGRRAVLRRIRALPESDREPPGDLLGALIAVYGRVLPDGPDAGEVPADVAPIVALSRHPDDRVRSGALAGLENLITRSTQMLDPERSGRIFDALESAGWDARDLEYRRALLALRFTKDPGSALRSARRLLGWAEARSDREALRFRFFGHYLEAVALAASGRADLSGPGLDRAMEVVHALSAARVDLLPESSKSSERRDLEAVQITRYGALVELMRATTLLLSGRPADDREVLEALRQTHVHLLEAQLQAHDLKLPLRVDVRCELDDVLDHQLGPRRLLYDNPTNPDLDRERGIELLRALGRGFATVAHNEMPGFEPFALESEGGGDKEVAALSDPLRDPERFELLFEYQLAWQRRLYEEARTAEISDRARRQFTVRARLIDQRMREAQDRLEAGDPRPVAFGFLARDRSPSQLALELARDLRLEGRPEETRELARRMLDDLRESGLVYEALESEIGLVIASSYTEEKRADEAEETLLGVLAELQAAVEQSRSAREAAREDGDTELVDLYDAFVQAGERRVADCLVSLAVNANVRQGERAKALEYFERAFELNQSDFMRALLACYRARSGRVEEARAELREVSPAPALYYNMACTYALMGEQALALDFLQRDFEENQQSPAALARQKAWAREDPDLTSLRDSPRFRALTGE